MFDFDGIGIDRVERWCDRVAAYMAGCTGPEGVNLARLVRIRGPHAMLKAAIESKPDKARSIYALGIVEYVSCFKEVDQRLRDLAEVAGIMLSEQKEIEKRVEDKYPEAHIVVEEEQCWEQQ